MSEPQRVGISELRVVRAPGLLASYGLGSCLGIALYDPVMKIGGLAHTLLPAPRQGGQKEREAKFVATAIRRMARQLEEMGADRGRIWAKVAGGANMFESLNPIPGGNIGARNAQSARSTLAELGIPLLAEEVGGNCGRTVLFDLASGDLMVRTVRGGEKVIVL